MTSSVLLEHEEIDFSVNKADFVVLFIIKKKRLNKILVFYKVSNLSLNKNKNK